jgi:hypothetical protein
MWIFCLISLAEMHTLRIVRNRYPNEEWIVLKAKANSFFGEVERLRNPLALAQDITTNRWPKLADLAIELENFLKACEALKTGAAPEVADNH